MAFYTNLDSVLKGVINDKPDSVKKGLEGIRDPANKDLVDRANAGFRRKALTPGAAHSDTTISQMSVGYANAAYIGLRLMPIIQVPHKSDYYFTFDKRSELNFPDDALGVRGSPNEITRARNKVAFATNGYGLKDFVDQSELANADAPLDDLADSTAGLLDAVAFKEESRIATIMTTAANYSGNTTALGSSVRWDDTGSNPIGDIQNARNSLWTGRGPSKVVAFTSLAVWNAMQANTQFQDLFKYTQGGILQPAQWAGYFGIDELLIGEARKDTANEGQTASYGRLWGDVFGLVRVATTPSRRNAAFGYTFRFGNIESVQIFDQMIGTKGGWWTKVGLDEAHQVVAPDTGFLLTSVIG